MTTEPTDEPDTHREGVESGSVELSTARDGNRPSSSRAKGVMGVALAVLLAYPVGRWLRDGSGRNVPAGTAAGQAEMAASFEHYRAGRYRESIISAETALAANPSLAAAYNNMAVAHLALGEFPEAIRAAETAIKLDPTDQLAKNNLKWIRDEETKRSAAGGEADPAAALVTQSLLHFEARRFEECVESARQAVAINPRSKPAFINIGMCSANLALWDEGIENTEEALRIDPTSDLAKNNLAWMRREKAKAAGTHAK